MALKLTNRRVMLLTASLALLTSACQRNTATVSFDHPEMAAWIELMMPQRIEIQKFTQPISRTGDGKADALEVILGCVDSTDEFTRVVGTFQFELYKRQLTRGLKLEERVAYWRREVRTAEQANEYWERYARYYRFPLSLTDGPPPAGAYLLKAQFTTPVGEHLFDEFLVEFSDDPVPPLEARY